MEAKAQNNGSEDDWSPSKNAFRLAVVRMLYKGNLSATTRNVNEANTKFDWFSRDSMQLLFDLFGFIILF
jgi:hypothetical protein